MGKKPSKKQKNTRGRAKKAFLWIIVIVLVLLLAVMLWLGWGLYNTQDPPTLPTIEPPAAPQPQAQVEELEETSINLDYGLFITKVGKYTGVFMEDGTDEVVSNVLMLIVTNAGPNPIQYAEILLPTEAGEAKFSLTTLPVGASVVLLEQSRMPWAESETYEHAVIQNVAMFQEPLTLQEDRIQLQMMDGVIQVTNISGEDITGEVIVYYKNSAEDLYYGGITYRARISDGIAAGETKQILTSHSTDSGSTIMFVTIA